MKCWNMYRKYRIMECTANSVSRYVSYRELAYHYTPTIHKPKWAAVEVWESMSDFVLHFTGHMITYPWWEDFLLVKEARFSYASDC